MVGTRVSSLSEAIAELDILAPDAPFLALGQTVFWDEPMKAGLANALRRMSSSRRFIAGVHDTDYFAKLPHGRPQPGKFQAFPHNDTSTQGLWSAAGEFSALFGSETVVSRDQLLKAGLRVGKIAANRPEFLDQATEAWGWRGIVSLAESSPVTAELPLTQVYPTIRSTFEWALHESIDSLSGQSGESARFIADALLIQLDQVRDELLTAKTTATLADFYERIAPLLYQFSSSTSVKVETTRTSELLSFNTTTANQKRFQIVNLFASQATRHKACSIYNETVRKSGQYDLSRFGTGAIPFDLLIPGVGRGTLRITKKAVIVMTPTPQFISIKKPLQSIQELAAAIEMKFGDRCVLIGKAIALIGMISAEFVFVFHEGASSYVGQSRSFHQGLAAQLGFDLKLNPILRVRYDAWDALQVCCSWIRLPAPLQRAFGTEELCAPSFAARWRSVGEEQQALLEKLGTLRRPLDLLAFLQERLAGSWTSLSREYLSLHDQLAARTSALLQVRDQRQALYARRRELRQDRVRAEVDMGEHFRQYIFEKPSNPQFEQEREAKKHALAEIVEKGSQNDRQIRTLMHRQRELGKDPEILKLHERRQRIELEAELARLRLIRGAVISSKGLALANRRPSAWWFRLVCPDGLWFRETVDSAHYYLEPLQ